MYRVDGRGQEVKRREERGWEKTNSSPPKTC